MSAFGYIRVSTMEQTEGTSLDDQRDQIEALAKLHKLELTTILADPGISGSIPLLQRPAGASLVALKSGDTVIVSKLDRAFRSAADALAMVEQWRKQGVRFIINGYGDVMATDNPFGQLMLEITAVFAGHERRMIRERLADGRRMKKAKGGHIGGSAPFGWRVEGVGRGASLVPVPEQQEALQTMRAAKADRLSLRKIADLVRERHGLDVSHMTVKAAMERPAE